MSASAHRACPLTGLYVILDPSVFATRDLADVVKESAAAGVRLFQYRDHTAMGDAYRRTARLRDATADVGALLIVNDRCDLALALEADGVHVGQADLPCAHARKLMGPGKLVGVSTHRLEELEEAARAGADYVGYGPIFETPTKQGHAPVVGLVGLQQARARTHLPIFAIGGVTLETARAVRRAGADGAAVISALATARDLAEAVRAFMDRLG